MPPPVPNHLFLQGDPSGWLQPPVDLGLGSCGSWWAAIVATDRLPYCPGKMVELSQREVVTIQMRHPVDPHLTVAEY